MKNLISIIIVLILICGNLLAQNFTRITEGDIVSDTTDSEGCSWIDVDNDGDLDMFVANRGGMNNSFYENNGNGIFTKSDSSIIVSDSGNSIGNTWGDYDNDGNLDLFVLGLGENNLLYQNNGDLTFAKIDSGEIVNDGGWSHSCSWGDYDNDGDLDLFVANGNDEKNFLYTNYGDGSFYKITSGDIVNDEKYSHACSWGDYDNDGDLDLFVSNGEGQNNQLYSNNGDGSFYKITSGGIFNVEAWSHGCSWGDYDNDGDLDLFVSNYFNENFLYENNGDTTFTKITEGDIVNDIGNSISSSWGDYDNDGDLDLFVTNSNGENNFLYSNNNDGTFTKITTGNIVSDGGNSEACSWGDYDNDGDLDLFVANRVEMWSEGFNFLYLNNGNSNHWINIRCFGTQSNSSAFGTKVRIKTTINGKVTWQMREISGQTGYASQNSLNAEFGLGDAIIIDSLKIEWLSGVIDEYSNVGINQFITATESVGITGLRISEHNVVTRFSLEQNYPNPFNPTTTVRYEIPKLSFVTIKVYDVLGNEIITLVNEEKTAGSYDLEFNAASLSSGVYFYRLQAGNFVEAKKMVLLK